MGLKGLLTSLEMNPFGIVSMILFSASFVAVLIWMFTRSKQEIETQSRLWEDDEDHVRTDTR